MNHEVKMLNSYKYHSSARKVLRDENWQETQYTLKLDTYKHKNSSFWDWLLVTVLDKDNKPVCQFVHNHRVLPQPLYTVQNNKEYIITSRDYRCISVYNITDKVFTDYTYPDDDNEFKNNRTICPELYEWDNKTNTLTITGSKWGGPEEIMILKNVNLDDIDMSNPSWKDYYEYKENDDNE